LLLAEIMEIRSGEATNMKFSRYSVLLGIAIVGAAVVTSAQPASALQRTSYGTGFAVTPDGYIITNNHVVMGKVRNRAGKVVGKRVCGGLSVKGKNYDGRVQLIARDAKNDLAVLKYSGSGKKRTTVSARVDREFDRVDRDRQRAGDEYERRGREYHCRSRQQTLSGSNGLFESGNNRSRELFEAVPRQIFDRFAGGRSEDGGIGRRAEFGGDTQGSGEWSHYVPLNLGKLEQGIPANVVGYPKQGISEGIKFNRGVVTGIVGIHSDVTRFQTDAVVNSGNSGGPIVDDSGNVIGVAVEKLTGGNLDGQFFAIKADTVAKFLQIHNVDYQSVGHGAPMHPVQVFRKAREFTMRVDCWM
jgi:hypothetical protein